MRDQALDATDRRMLTELQRDGRLTNLELAERVGLSASPCLRRLRSLEASGVIEGYSVNLNRRKLGLGLHVFVFLSVERHTDADPALYRAKFSALPEVTSCHLISGEHDFLLQVVAADLDAYREFTLERLLKIPGIKDVHSSFVIDTFKDNGPLPLRHLG